MQTNAEYIKSRITERAVASGFTDCWVWTLSISNRGYAQSDHKRGSVQAHRVSYAAFIGPIPPRTDIDHLCRNRACVNPGHLEAVSHQENLLRGHESRTGRRESIYQRASDGLWCVAIALPAESGRRRRKVISAKTESGVIAKLAEYRTLDTSGKVSATPNL